MIDFDAAMCYAMDARNERGFWQSRKPTTIARLWGWVLVNAVVGCTAPPEPKPSPKCGRLYLEEVTMDILALLAVGVIVWVVLGALIGRDERRYEIKRGWRLPPDKWK